ncbi:MAG: DNA gyrase inhibitor YacG [Hylemonella sp.]
MDFSTRSLPRVACPCCGTDTLYTTDNPDRPFCSERCRKIDLGAWASESFRVPAEAPPEEAFGDPRLQ